MSKHPNNTPTQKAAWETTRGGRLGSKHIKVHDALTYKSNHAPAGTHQSDAKRRALYNTASPEPCYVSAEMRRAYGIGFGVRENLHLMKLVFRNKRRAFRRARKERQANQRGKSFSL